MTDSSPLSKGKTRPRASLIVAGSVIVILAAWKILSVVIGAEILLPPPERVFVRFFTLAFSPSFWTAVGATAARALLGFSASLVPAVLLGFWAGRNEGARLFLSPGVTVVRSTPVLAVILLALIWFADDLVPVFIAILMAFPVMYGNVVEGVRSVDGRLLEMARAYRVDRRSVYRQIYLPSLFPFLVSGASTALGITWKVVIAAEVLSQPAHAIGSGMQNAKIELETADVFAWTMAALLLSALTEGLFDLLARRRRRYGNQA